MQQIKRALLGWKTGINSHAAKGKKKVGDAMNFGSTKDKIQFEKFYISAKQISDERWNEIWLRSLEYITQNSDGADSDSDGADSDDERYNNAEIIMSD